MVFPVTMLEEFDVATDDALADADVPSVCEVELDVAVAAILFVPLILRPIVVPVPCNKIVP